MANYTGPAGIVFTREQLLIIWQYLTRIPTAENAEIRKLIADYLNRDK